MHANEGPVLAGNPMSNPSRFGDSREELVTAYLNGQLTLTPDGCEHHDEHGHHHHHHHGT
jgi:hypothetical protein